MFVLAIYVIAAAVPAYFMTRSTWSFWRNLWAWLTGFAVECLAVISVFLIAVSMDEDAAPLAAAIALTPPLPLLLILPTLGLALGNLEHLVRWRFSRSSN
jgi:hypothetical protein